jgi:hypothetical protein
MEVEILIAMRTLFAVAALAPLVLVVRYRWFQVPARREEIKKALLWAHTGGAENERAEAEAKFEQTPYAKSLEKTFDRVHDVKRYVLPLTVLCLITWSSTVIGYAWVASELKAPATLAAPAVPTTAATPATPAASGTPAPHLPANLPTVVIMALAGGLLWTLLQIIERTRTGELVPADLQEINLGFLSAVPIGYAFSLLTQEMNGVRSFMAFAAALFPTRDVVRLFREQATRRMLDAKGSEVSRPAERHLGTAIDGVSDQALSRLAELRIVTALDLAYSDPARIMVETGYRLPVIIDWIDQAIWSLYCGDLKEEMNKQGLRCSLDVCEFVDMHLRDAQGNKLTALEPSDKAALDALAAKLGTTSELLSDMFFRIANDPQITVLRELWYAGAERQDLERK